MREIKFRAWLEGHMYEVAKLDFWGDPGQATCDLAGAGENGEWEELFDIYVSDVKLMQSTGLLDKNGKEIYEGDVVKNRHYSFEIGIDGAQIFARQKGTNYKCHLHDLFFESAMEVIGNIYENPELLKEREE